MIKPKFNVDVSLSYSFSDNMIVNKMDVAGDHIFYSFANVGHQKKLAANAYFQWSPTDKTSIYGNISYAFTRQSMPDGTSLSRP